MYLSLFCAVASHKSCRALGCHRRDRLFFTPQIQRTFLQPDRWFLLIGTLSMLLPGHCYRQEQLSLRVCISFPYYINIQWCGSQTQQTFIMFIILLGQHVSILIESSSGPSKKTDPCLGMFKMRCGIPNAYILDKTMYRMHVSFCSYCTIRISISKTLKLVIYSYIIANYKICMQ